MPAGSGVASSAALAGLLRARRTGPAAQQQPAVRAGRVEIGIPITTRRPSAAYPSRSVPGARARARIRTAPRRRLPARRAAGRHARDGRHSAARRELHASRRRGAGGIRGRVPERRPDLPQRVLALAREELQPGPLSTRRHTSASASTSLASSRCSAKSTRT